MKILVTGADGGIGSAIVKALKAIECELIETTSKDTDITKPDAVRALKERIGSVDWIVAAHGFIDTETTLEQQSPENIEKTFAVNSLSIVWLAKEFPTSNMIAISSSAGIAPNGHYAAYSASKAAVNALVQALARNRQERTFFALAPGPTNTEMRQRIAGDAAQMQSPAVVAALARDLILGKTENKSGDIILIRDGAISVVSRL